MGLSWLVPLALLAPPSTDWADRFLRAYDDLFQDLDLVKEGKVGLTRVPFDLASRHGIPGPRGSASASKSASAIVALRMEAKAAGYAIEEGVLTLRPDRIRQVYDPAKWKAAMEKGGRDYTKVPTQPSPVALWISNRTLQMARPPQGPALFANQNRSLTVELPEHTAFATRAVAAHRKNANRDYKETIQGWTLTTRTIPFRKKECRSCHADADVGKPATLVSIAVRRR